MHRIEVVSATIAHVVAMVPHVRQADIDELRDGWDVTPREALVLGLKISDHPRAAMIDGKVLCVFGVTRSIHAGWFVPWMIASEDILACRREWLEHSRETIHLLRRVYGPLENWVDARNRLAIRWLRWCGFEIEAPAPYGPHGLPFCRFSMKEIPCAG